MNPLMGNLPVTMLQNWRIWWFIR